MKFAVSHPEVDETLYVEESVVRVACPQCKVKAGVPCKGARFEWMEARGERRGFRYVQGTHKARRSMFQDWKRNGRPAHIPANIVETYASIHGPFPKRVDRKAQPAKVVPLIQRPAKPRAAKKAKSRSYLGPRETVEHPQGVVWETYGDHKMWTWSPYIEWGDYASVYVHDMRPQFSISVSLGGTLHKCESLEEAFETGVQLVAQRAFLDVLNERARWRVRELERRYGAAL